MSSLQLTSDSESDRGFLRWLRPFPVHPHSRNPSKCIEVPTLVTPKFPDSEIPKPNSPGKKEPSIWSIPNSPLEQSIPVQSIPGSPAKVHPKQSSPKQSIQTDSIQTVHSSPVHSRQSLEGPSKTVQSKIVHPNRPCKTVRLEGHDQTKRTKLRSFLIFPLRVTRFIPPIHSKGSRKHEQSFHGRQTGSIPFRKTAQGWANLSRPKLTHRCQVNKVAHT